MTTSNPSSSRMTDVESQLIAQATRDAEFRDRLIANPKAVLAEQGITIPDDVQIQILQESARQYYLILPVVEVSDATKLSEQELETVAGGGMAGLSYTWNSGWTGCAGGCGL
ncbi:NHLP leader peptide family RiPP precursor [Leptolyngbya boryana FACHB-1624]